MKTIYPRTKFVDENTIPTQLYHLQSEWREVKKATEESMERIAEETCDLIHSAETLLRQLGRIGVDVGKIQQEVIEKNRARGYYLDGEGKV